MTGPFRVRVRAKLPPTPPADSHTGITINPHQDISDVEVVLVSNDGIETAFAPCVRGVTFKATEPGGVRLVLILDGVDLDLECLAMLETYKQ